MAQAYAHRDERLNTSSPEPHAISHQVYALRRSRIPAWDFAHCQSTDSWHNLCVCSLAMMNRRSVITAYLKESCRTSPCQPYTLAISPLLSVFRIYE